MKNKSAVYKMSLIGLMSALICVMAPFTLPLPFTPIPISLTNLAVHFAVFILGWKYGTISYLIYLLIGFAGLPVFSGFTGGAGRLLGPTGGYLVGFIFMAVVSGIFIERFHGGRLFSFLGMALGMAAAYIFGSAWLAWQSGMDMQAALAAGALPFIPGDIAKILLVLALGPAVKRRLARAGVV